MELWLVDIEADVVAAWTAAFSGMPDVFTQRGNILALADNALVSPANSYGGMDGGIDRLYLEHFGVQLQTRLQREIDEHRGGRLAVGAALLLTTGDAKIPYLIAAPTMENPGPVGAENCFFAMSAILKVAAQHAHLVTRVFCPGLGTGVGEVDPHDSAREMASAYRKFLTRGG